MLRNIWKIKNHTIHASDGHIGRVEDFYFDDITWSLRYVVVDTGNWFAGNYVLISPIALSGFDSDEGCLKTDLTCEQISNAPNADTQRPETRQWETAYHDYFGWPYYWEGIGWYGAAYLPRYAEEEIEEANEAAETELREKGNEHLQSAQDVGECRISARDGEIGHVVDYLVDDENWLIRYIVVDLGNWLPGKKVLLATSWIRDISWDDSSVEVDLPQEVLRHAPPYVASEELTREYEKGLFDYYKPHLSSLRQKPYWEFDQDNNL